MPRLSLRLLSRAAPGLCKPLWGAGCLATLLLAACSETAPSDPEPEPLFPEDVADWDEGRPCSFTHEHELRYIRVVVNELAKEPYAQLSEDYPYEEGAMLVKLEYDDENCTELVGYTAMEKQAPGYSEEGNDWRWQRVGVDRKVIEDGAELTSCINCHEHHCTYPECGYEKCGYDLTCGIEE